MLLELYKTSDRDNVINKTLTNKQDLQILLKRDVDIVRPELILSKIEGVNFNDFNYCSIPELDRKYFIRFITSMSNNVSKLVCECDVLETYKAQILASNASIMRKPRAGDYGPIQVDETGRKSYSTFESDVEMVATENSILSAVVWN